MPATAWNEVLGKSCEECGAPATHIHGGMLLCCQCHGGNVCTAAETLWIHTIGMTVRKLAAHRITAKGLKFVANSLVEDVKARHTDLFNALSDEVATTKDLEAALRTLTIDYYTESGDKKPWPGVGVRERRVVDYDPKEAEAWAREHQPHLLVLDAKAFENYVKAMGEIGQISSELAKVAMVLKEPYATISKNLEEK